MAEIDPIRERRDREEQERKNESLKKVMWILVAVAVLLARGTCLHLVLEVQPCKGP